MLHRRPKRIISDMNVVPYIDVMLVLLVIFMTTVPLFSPGRIDLPSVSAGVQTVTDVPIVVEMTASNRFVYRDGDRSSKEAQSIPDLVRGLNRILATGVDAEKNRVILLSADKKLTYQEVLSVADQLRQAQFDRIALMVKP